jgi:snRNA-activating protein complex subunit 3
MVFDEIKLMTDEECQNALAYPLQVFEGSHVVRKCTICKIAAAKKVTYGDKLAPESPCFFCGTCYEQLHYTKDTAATALRLAYTDFEVYPYYHEC